MCCNRPILGYLFKSKMIVESAVPAYFVLLWRYIWIPSSHGFIVVSCNPEKSICFSNKWWFTNVIAVSPKSTWYFSYPVELYMYVKITTNKTMFCLYFYKKKERKVRKVLFTRSGDWKGGLNISNSQHSTDPSISVLLVIKCNITITIPTITNS